MTTQTDLAALLGARLCHDLISPLGAIGNGVELLMLDGKPPSPELALIAEAVAAANARIRFLRVAVGLAGAGQQIGAAEVTGLLADTLDGGRISVEWQPQGPQDRREVRRAFRALMCLYGTLPAGGRITVTRTDAAWQFTAAGPNLRHDATLWDLLSDPQAEPPELTPAQVQFALLRADLLAGPGPARVEHRPEGLHLRYPTSAA